MVTCLRLNVGGQGLGMKGDMIIVERKNFPRYILHRPLPVGATSRSRSYRKQELAPTVER